MFRFNPDLMQFDDTGTGAPSVTGASNDTSQITEAEIKAASAAAAKELAMTPYNELPADVKASMDRAEKQAYISAANKERIALAAEERAASDPMFDFTNRPDAPPSDDNFITYYSWIGARSNGEWRLYRVSNTPANQAKYGSRAVGGETQATATSIVGANALVNQPQPTKDEDGNIVSWSVSGSDGTGAADSGVTGGGITGGALTGGGITGGTTGGGITSGGTTGGGTTGGGTTGGGMTDSNMNNSLVVSTYSDPTTGDVTAVMSDGTTRVLAPGGARDAERKSAYDLLYSEFEALGVGGLVPALRDLITEGVSPAEFTLRLRQTDAYKKRFAANAQRVTKGLRALSEAEYIGLEDQFQDVMRRYGLPESYYARGDMGRQVGFEQLIANDVSNVELEDRISTAQRRVLNANPEVTQALKQFYPDISNGDILAFTLDPKNAIENIKRKVTAAEIGGAAIQSGLQTGVARAEQLQAAGVDKQSAQQGFGTIAGGLQRGSQLAAIYGESPYTQTTAETEVFNIAGAQDARKQRQKITGLEKATFGGQTGITSSALARDRAGNF